MRYPQLLLIAFLNTVALTSCVPIAEPPNVGIAVVNVEGADPLEGRRRVYNLCGRRATFFLAMANKYGTITRFAPPTDPSKRLAHLLQSLKVAKLSIM